MCTHFDYESFCEELFQFKHKSKHSCAGAIFNLLKNVIESNFNFKSEFKTTGTPSILDGISNIILANIC